MLKKELFQGREETVPLMDWFGPQFTQELMDHLAVAFVIPNLGKINENPGNPGMWQIHSPASQSSGLLPSTRRNS